MLDSFGDFCPLGIVETVKCTDQITRDSADALKTYTFPDENIGSIRSIHTVFRPPRIKRGRLKPPYKKID